MRFVLLAFLAGVGVLAQPQTPPAKAAPAAAAAKPGACVIKVNEVGPIKAGISIRAARQALPGTVFKQTEEVGGQVSFFSVSRAGKKIMDLYPDQEDGIKETSKIETIRVYDPECKTADGLYPGMPLIGVEVALGTLKKLIVVPSEKREYAQFEKQPNWLEIQVGSGGAGLYEPGELCTRRYKADARVESFWVSHPLENNILAGDDYCKAEKK